jgi:hypothetical protein
LKTAVREYTDVVKTDESLEFNNTTNDVHGAHQNADAEQTRRLLVGPPNRAIDKMNNAVGLLHHIIAVLNSKVNSDLQLPQLKSIETLDHGILELNRIIEKLSDGAKPAETGALGKVGFALENICKVVTPFLKVFLAVGVQGSAVGPASATANPLYRFQFLIHMDYCAADFLFSLL